MLLPCAPPCFLVSQRLNTKLYFPRSLSEVTGISWVKDGSGERRQGRAAGWNLLPDASQSPSLSCMLERWAPAPCGRCTGQACCPSQY